MTQPQPVERNFVTIVSGLPRSGTSMMLQMLAAGGMPILTDNVRAADQDNLLGYLEWEGVKSLKRDSSWVAGAVGKAVKAIYCFLGDLPVGFEYRVIFMRRDLDEVLASQATMLARRGVTEAQPDDKRMKRLFEDELAEVEKWLAGQPSFSKLDVDYHAVIDDPERAAEQVSSFLGGGLDCQAMATVVDPAMYRRRAR